MNRLGGIAALAVLAACGPGRDPGRLPLSGTLEMTEHSVGARAAGRLVKAEFEEGEEVRRGQLLATLDRHDQASRDLARVRDLFKEGGASKQAVEAAELALEDQRVLSPVDGPVLVKVRQTGEIVGAGGAVAVVGDRRELWVRVFVTEGSVNRLKPGLSATVRFDGLERDFRGRVSFVSPKAEFTPRNVQTPEERVTQVFAVKVAIEDPEPRLRPGVAADVTLVLEAP